MNLSVCVRGQRMRPSSLYIIDISNSGVCPHANIHLSLVCLVRKKLSLPLFLIFLNYILLGFFWHLRSGVNHYLVT